MTRIGFAVLAAALALPMSSAAAPVTWVFGGEIRAIEGATAETLATLSSLGVTEGSAFSGQIVFESTTPDVNASSNFGNYLDPVLSYAIDIGLLHAEFGSGDPYNQMTVSLQTPGAHAVQALGYGPGTSSLFSSPILELYLLGSAGLVLPSDALPLVPPLLSSLHPYDHDGVDDPGTGYGTGVIVIGTEANLFGELTSLAVPEPGSFALLAPMLLAFAALRRR